LPCPTGAVCTIEEREWDPVSAPGFWRSYHEVSSASAAEMCDEERRAPFREFCPSFGKCMPDHACQGENECARGYEWVRDMCEDELYDGRDRTCSSDLDCDPNPGAECSIKNPEQCSFCSKKPGALYGNCTCAAGASRCSLCTAMTHYKINGKCERCPDNPELIIAAFVSALFLCAVGGYALNKKQFNLAFITIGWDYFQVLALFATINVEWPSIVLDFFDVLKFFSFNIDIAAPECLTPNLAFENKWALMMLVPVATALLLVLAYVGGVAIKWASGIRSKELLHKHVNGLYASGFIMMYYLYLPLTEKVVEVFNCSELEPSDGSEYTAWTSPSCAGGLCKCWVPGEVQMSLVPYAVLALACYTILYPIVVMRVIFMHKPLIKIDQILRAMGTGDDPVSNPEAYHIRVRYHKIYYHFKPGKVYWILVILSRKFLLGIASLIFSDSPAFALAFVLLVLFVNYVLQVQHRPFMSTAEREEAVRQHQQKVIDGDELHVGIDTILQKAQETAREHGVSGARKVVRRISAKREQGDLDVSVATRTRYFFDFNTVELFLLASAVLVCVFGIMFESPTQNENAWDFGLGILTVVVITVSLFYYFIVFVSELMEAMGWMDSRCMLALIRLFASQHNASPNATVEKRDSVTEGAFIVEANPMYSKELEMAEFSQGSKRKDEARADILKASSDVQQDRDDLIRRLEQENHRAREKLYVSAAATKRLQPQGASNQAGESEDANSRSSFVDMADIYG